MFSMLKLAVLFLSSIGVLSCSQKASQRTAPRFQIHVLEKTAEKTEPAKNNTSTLSPWSVKNLNDTLHWQDLIYFATTSNSVFKYQKQEPDGTQLRVLSTCQSGSQKVEKTVSLFSYEVSVYAILPPLILVSSLEWTCNFEIEIKTAQNNSATAYFKNKKIINTDFQASSLLYESQNIKSSATVFSEKTFSNYILKDADPMDEVELACESFASAYSVEPSAPTLQDIASSKRIQSYAEETTSAQKVDPRFIQPQQLCRLRIFKKSEVLISNAFTLDYVPLMPEKNCETHTLQFHFSGSRKMHIQTLHLLNPHSIPITVALNRPAYQYLIHVEYESGGGRESDGHTVGENKTFPAEPALDPSFAKTIDAYDFIFLLPGQSVSIPFYTTPWNQKNAQFTLHERFDPICTIFAVQKNESIFENLQKPILYQPTL